MKQDEMTGVEIDENKEKIYYQWRDLDSKDYQEYGYKINFVLVWTLEEFNGHQGGNSIEEEKASIGEFYEVNQYTIRNGVQDSEHSHGIILTNSLDSLLLTLKSELEKDRETLIGCVKRNLPEHKLYSEIEN